MQADYLTFDEPATLAYILAVLQDDVAGIVTTWIAACCVLPASVEFGELRTFRDLAETLAAGERRTTESGC